MHRGRLIGIVVGTMLVLPTCASAVSFGLPPGDRDTRVQCAGQLLLQNGAATAARDTIAAAAGRAVAARITTYGSASFTI